MKTINHKGLLMAAAMVALSVSSALASTGKIMVNPYLNTKYAIVSVVVPTSEGAHLTIKDVEGNSLYVSSKITNAESFQRLIDLSTLSNGTYKVALSGKDIREMNTFTVENHKLTTTNKMEIPTAESIASFKLESNDRLFVHHSNPSGLESAMAIYDAKGETVYYSTLPSNEKFAGLYKLNALPSGQYKVELYAGNKTHRYDFEK
jgi:hypothetical protein